MIASRCSRINVCNNTNACYKSYYTTSNQSQSNRHGRFRSSLEPRVNCLESCHREKASTTITSLVQQNSTAPSHSTPLLTTTTSSSLSPLSISKTNALPKRFHQRGLSSLTPVEASAIVNRMAPEDSSSVPWGVLLLSSVAAFGVSSALVYTFPSTISSTKTLDTNDVTIKRSGNVEDTSNSTVIACSYDIRAAYDDQTVLPHVRIGHRGIDHPATIRLQRANKTIRTDDRSADEFFHESSKSGKTPYDISVRALQGGRMTMEDEYFIADGGRFVAVFDGHGGSGVSQYLKNNLHNAMKKHLKLKHWEETELLHANHQALTTTALDSSRSNLQADERHEDLNEAIPSVASHVAALRSAFAEIEKDVIENDQLKFQGSTAVAVLVHESEDGHRTLLSANVGDSRAILSRNQKAIELTRDHKPNDEREKARILAMGETIEWDRFARVHRVKSLSLSRAIGDRYAKPVVSSEVDIAHYPILEEENGGDEFILLASDGLWDVMSSDDVVQFVYGVMDKELGREMHYQQGIADGDKDYLMNNFKFVLRKNMAKHVAREAIRRGSADNVCVIMVWLSDLNKSTKSEHRK